MPKLPLMVVAVLVGGIGTYALINSLAATTTPAPLGPGGTWNISFDDEFNGTSLDTTKWSTGWFGSGVTGPINTGDELQCYDPSQVVEANGYLSLNLIKQTQTCPTGSGNITQAYKSGIVTTDPKQNTHGTSSGFKYTYGFYEARVYLPAANNGSIANWPAVWADGTGTWPQTGELDVMEGLGGSACWHFHDPSGGPGGCANGNFAGGWHTFGADWEPGKVTYYYDGQNVGTITSGITADPMYLLLNNAVDNTYGGPITTPANMQIDYVRVWSYGGNSTTVPPPTASDLVTSQGFEGGNLNGWNIAGVGDVVPTVVSDQARSGTKSARFVLTGNQGRSELILGGDGSASTAGTYSFKEGDDYYYAFSVYINQMVYGQPGGHNLIFQLKGDDQISPALALQLWNSPGAASDGSPGGKGLWYSGSTLGSDRFISPISEHQWHDIVVHFKVSNKGAGSDQIYLDGKVVRSDTNVNTMPTDTSSAYIKNGIYRNGTTVVGTSDIRIDDAKLGTTYAAVAEPSSSDTTNPTASMTAPYSGAVVADQVPLAASASDDTGVTKVEFYVDSNLISTDATAPYTATWNAVNATGGIHTITAKAYDAAGNVGTSSGITATVIASPPIAPEFPKDGNVELTLHNPGTPYASTSFWNTLLPSSTSLNPNNTTYVNSILSDLSQQSANSAALNNIRWSAPLYVVPANQPLVPVKPYCWTGNVPGSGFTNGVLAGGIPIPADAHAAAGTDEHISIYQPSTDKLWEFWRLQKDNSGAWEACWGGRLDNVSTSDGIFPYPYGGWTTGLPLLGSVVRIEELQAGHIDHVIGIGLPNNLVHNLAPANISGAANGISWPANRSDGTSTDPLAIPEGQRFRLPANLDLSQYNLTPVAKMIAVAAQKYGFVVTDTGSVGLSLGDPTTYTAAGFADPYIQLYGSDYNNPGAVMQNFPWDKLQALPFDYGKPVPPPPSDTTPPNAPTSLNATAGNSTTVNLSWTASADTGANQTGVVKYNVLRNGVVIARPTGTSYTDTGRTANTSYSYMVQAMDGAGNASANSNTASVTTPKAVDTTPPTTPAGLSAAAVSIDQVNLSWTASTDTGGSGLAGYNVYRNGSKLNTSLVTTTSYGDSTAAANTSYSYKVEAVDGSGNKSAQTSAVSANTPPIVRGDITGPAQAPDGKINLQDVSYEIRNYNTSDTTGDVSGPNGTPDGKVDLYDLSYIIRNYGK